MRANVVVDAVRSRAIRLYCGLLILALAATPLGAVAQDAETDAPLEPAVHEGADEVVLINRNDGRVVIQDFAVEPGTADLTGKYDIFGGPYYDVAAGDFDGNGRREIVVIGGLAVTQPGPILNVWDPVALRAGEPQLPNLSVNVSPNVWTHVAVGDINHDGRDKIVAIRTADEGIIRAHIVAFGFDPGTGQWRPSPLWDLPTAGGFVDLDVGDFDGDGADDVILAREGRIIIVNDGEAPTVTHFQAEIGTLSSWTRAKVGNIDGVGTPELVLLRPQPALSDGVPAAVLAIHPTGVSTWTDVARWGFTDPPVDIRLSDINTDGVPEVIALTTGAGASIYTLNPRLPAEAGGIEDRLLIGDNLWGPVLRLGDANGDGRPERMLVERNGTFLRVWDYYPGGGTADVVGNGPYWRNFVAANLDGPGVQLRPRLRVPDYVSLFYHLSAARGTSETIAIENVGSGSFNWIAVMGACPWLNASRLVGTAGQTITFSVVSAFLPGTTPGTTATCPVGVQATATDGGIVLENNQAVTVSLLLVSNLRTTRLPLVFR
ncbi:MAG: hypothetical protein HPY83_02490 [Anaerolineae bacterium]|nr:hypothetical protein [Anaerolineae bacterium]